MPVEFEPPRIAIVVDKATWTRDLIAKSGMFGICIPTVSIMDFTYAVGSVLGLEKDNSKVNAIEASKIETGKV